MTEARLNLVNDFSHSQKQTIEKLEKAMEDVNNQARAKGLEPIVPQAS